MKIVIRAGGVGSRLWPVSREKKPKQLHALVSNKTMLQEAIERSLISTKPDSIYISGNKNTESLLRKELGAVLENNLIIEPARRDTAAAVGLETIVVAKEDPQAIIASLGSDHAISNNKEFDRLLKVGERFLKKYPDYLLCLGIQPNSADIGYGYIELNKKIDKEIYSVKSFKEKPVLKIAKKYISTENYLWNGNMFMWRADTILNLYKKHQSKMYKQLMQIQDNPSKLKTIYPKIEKLAVDYAILEKAKHIAALPADIGWNDIGDWARLKDELADTEKDNVIKAEHVCIDTENTLVFSETKKLIATVGIENLIVIETDDALLVCDKYRSGDVKKIIDELKKNKKNKYL